jgi:glycine dehydrogenase
MAIANASMLDEATAAAEAMTLAALGKSKSNHLRGRRRHPSADAGSDPDPRRAAGHHRQGAFHDASNLDAHLAADDCYLPPAAVPRRQRPGSRDLAREDRRMIHAKGAAFMVAADLLALTLLTPPGEMGRRHRRRHHPALGHAHGQRRPARGLHGLPDEFKRSMPGRLVGVSVDVHGNPPIAWRCRPASSTSAAKRPPPTSAPRRCCPP